MDKKHIITPAQRIKSLDILRGYFLVVILINHIELYPSGFDLFTGRGRLLVSAAEGFFFMSGLLVGMVYKRRLALGMRFIFRKMWKRAFQLYLGSVVLTLLFTALAIFLNHPTIKDGLYGVINWPHIIYESLLMRYGFGWADFLDRFAILMFMAPFAFYLLARGRWKLLAVASLTAWAFRGNNFTLSWQIVFALGMGFGFYWHEFKGFLSRLSEATLKRLKLAIFSVAWITFLLSYASVYLLSVLNQKLTQLPLWLQHFTLGWNTVNADVWLYAQKWTMGPIRIVLFMVWFTALYLWVERHYDSINKYSKGFIELLGQNSLFVYITHAFIVFAFKFFIAPNTTLWQNFLITAAALALLIVITWAYKRYYGRDSAVHKKVAHIKRNYLKIETVKSS